MAKLLEGKDVDFVPIHSEEALLPEYRDQKEKFEKWGEEVRKFEETYKSDPNDSPMMRMAKKMDAYPTPPGAKVLLPYDFSKLEVYAADSTKDYKKLQEKAMEYHKETGEWPVVFNTLMCRDITWILSAV